MLVTLAEPSDALSWSEYVDAHPGACVYHEFAWREVFERAYGSKPVFLIARQGRRVVGVLPMIGLESLAFGRILCGMPFFGHGGMLADDEQVAEALAAEAARRGRDWGVRSIELRHLVDHDLGWEEGREKVNMVLPLPEGGTEELLRFRNLKKKSRDKLKAQIRRPEKAGHQSFDGRHDLLHAFWQVYSENLRDLASPCHSERLFDTILDVFGPRARTFAVFADEQPIAGGIVVGGQGTLEIPCASSLGAFNRSSPNMMLYAEVLRYACEEGYERFNFGRSTRGEGTYRFKKQWGARPVPLTYHRWRPAGSEAAELKADNPKFELAIRAWQRLPVAVARLLGPPLVKGIP